MMDESLLNEQFAMFSANLGENIKQEDVLKWIDSLKRVTELLTDGFHHQRSVINMQQKQIDELDSERWELTKKVNSLDNLICYVIDILGIVIPEIENKEINNE